MGKLLQGLLQLMEQEGVLQQAQKELQQAWQQERGRQGALLQLLVGKLQTAALQRGWGLDCLLRDQLGLQERVDWLQVGQMPVGQAGQQAVGVSQMWVAE